MVHPHCDIFVTWFVRNLVDLSEIPQTAFIDVYLQANLITQKYTYSTPQTLGGGTWRPSLLADWPPIRCVKGSALLLIWTPEFQLSDLHSFPTQGFAQRCIWADWMQPFPIANETTETTDRFICFICIYQSVCALRQTQAGHATLLLLWENISFLVGEAPPDSITWRPYVIAGRAMLLEGTAVRPQHTQ